MSGRNYVNVENFCISYDCSQKKPESLDIRHCHESYEILYVINGSGRYIVEGREYPVRPRSLIVIPPLKYHCVDLDSDAPYDRYVVHFNASDLTQDIQKQLSLIFDEEDGVGCFYSAESISPLINSLFERFESCDFLAAKEKEMYAKLIISEMILLLSVANKEKIPFDEAELGARVIRYLNEHIDKDISLDKLAKKFFVSKYYLCRAFKSHNGISVHGYINQKRVMYAKQLIESGETASGAAYKVGFGDYSAFYRAYVKIVGRSPTSQEKGGRSNES